MPDPAWVYFVHSYAPELTADTSSTCDYGGPVTASAERGPVWGTQFHPEKSGAVGPRHPRQLRRAPSARRAGGLMDLYPAIDIRGGGAVRLVQGDFDRQSDYGDPVELARRFAAAGARWLHVVDLDAARTGRAGQPARRSWPSPPPSASRSSPAGECAPRRMSRELLAGGVRRVVLGTLALEDPGLARALAATFPGRVAVGIDYRLDADGRTEVAVRGWEQGSGRTVAERARRSGGRRGGRRRS